MASASFAVDLHVHSHLSGDNCADPAACVERAIELGLHGIAFTEHYSFAASEPIERLAERYRRRILVLRAVEFSAEEGHCLVFGADTDRLQERYAPAEDLVRLVRSAGGVVVPSHPYRGGSGLADLAFTLPGVAAVEGHNGCNAPSLNERAIRVAGRQGLPFTGGSDAHRPEDVGSCVTLFAEPVTAENLVGLLRSGRFTAEDRRSRGSRGMFRS